MRKNTAFLLLGSLFGTALFSCVPTSGASSDYSTCQVVVERGSDYDVAAPVKTVVKGGDISFAITTNHGAIIAACDYGNSSIASQGNYFTLTLHQVRYSLVVKPFLSYENENYYANGGLRNDGGDESLPLSKPLPQKKLRRNSERGYDLFHRAGYLLSGWNTASDGSGLLISLGSRFESESYPSLYASWIAEEPASHFSYQEEAGGVTLTGYSGNANPLVIPAAIGGKNVKKIAQGALKGLSCQTLYLPPYLESVEAGAIGGDFLTDLVFYDGLKAVYDASFACPKMSNIRINAILAPGYSGTYFDAFPDKMDHLRQIADKKKLVFFAGSSARYGFYSPLFKEAFPSYEFCNMGTFAWANAKIEMDWTKSLMRAGDTLLEGGEFDAVPTQYCLSNAFDRYLFAECESDYDLLSLLDLRDYTGFFAAYAQYADAKNGLDKLNYFISPKSYDDDGAVHQEDTYNVYGDYTLSRPNSASDIQYSVAPADYTTLTVTPEAAAHLQTELQSFLDKGITVYYAYTPRNHSSVTERSTLEKRQEVATLLESTLKVPFVNTLESSFYSGIYFYLIDSHLSTEGAIIHSNGIINDLKAMGVR